MQNWVARILPAFGPSLATQKRTRIYAIDGLRGWAALSVVCYHLLWETFGVVHPAFRSVLTAFMLDGSLAVSIFFVLSGEALSASYFSGKGPKAVADLAIRRYPRLAIPVFATSVVTTAIVALGLAKNVEAGPIVDRAKWLGSWLTTPVGVERLLRFSLYDVFAGIDPDKALVPFLWTMKFELLGSVLTFCVLLVCHNRRFGWPLVALLAGWLIQKHMSGSQTCGYLACFVAGIVFAKLRFAGLFDRAHTSRVSNALTAGFILILLAGDSILHASGVRYFLAMPFIAAALVLALFLNSSASKFLGNRASRYLGRASFPLFLVQFPVIVSFTSWMITASDAKGSAFNALVIFSLSLLVCFLAAWAFEPVERFTFIFCRRLSTWLTSRKPVLVP